MLLASGMLSGQQGLEPRAVIPVVTGIVNAATGAPNITSGGWATIYGSGFIWSSSGFTRPWLPADFVNGNLPLQLNDISVRFNGVPTYVAYISPNQINVLIPDDPAIGMVAVQEQGQLDQSNIILANKVALSPGLFPLTSRYPAAVHLDGTYCGAANVLAGVTTAPARPGEVIELFGTGFGPNNPKIDFGKLFFTPSPTAQIVTATVGAVAANVASYLVSPGLYQFNLTVPNLPDGDALVVLTIAGQSTQSEMYLAVAR
jgi:uncharacterized protein (TIGR03437 family)